ncbi:MAG: hypothetical protein AAF690_30525 [Acidobacteriota bacterium]
MMESDLLARASSSQHLDASAFVGLTLRELALFEVESRRPLPASYRELLLFLGKNDQDVFAEFGTTPGRMLSAAAQTREAKAVMAEVGAVLPEDAFVLHVHLADEVYYLPTRQGADPPVVLWLRDASGESHDPRWRSVSDFALWVLDHKIEHWEKHGRC